MAAVVYGIPNCDSVRKARKWLADNEIAYKFVDVRENPPDAAKLHAWTDAVGAGTLVNRRSTTWKQLDPTARQRIDAGDVIDTLAANPTLIKRPVLEFAGTTMVGFEPDSYRTCFGTN